MSNTLKDELKNRKSILDEKVKEKEEEIKRIRASESKEENINGKGVPKGKGKKIIKRIKILFSPIKTPLDEIYDDWCTVNNFVEGVKDDYLHSKDDQEKKENRNKLRLVVAAQAYLNLARHEKDLGQAWKYVNSADKLLPLIVDEEALDQCLIRLRIWDEKLPEDLKKTLNVTFIIINRMYQIKLLLAIRDNKLPKELIQILDDLAKKENILFGFEGQIGVWNEDIHENLRMTLNEVLDRIKEMNKSEETPRAPNTSDLKDTYIMEVKNRILKERRKAEYYRQAVRSQLWNSINSATSLRLRLWRLLTIRVIVLLIVAILVAETIYTTSNPDKYWLHFPFFYISILGFFGGGLSAVLIARGLVIYAPSPTEIKMQIRLRMFIGAAGAFVLYIIIGSGLLEYDYSLLLEDNIYGFLALGIAAGFSEQLFVEPLNKISQNLSILGKTN